MKPRLNRTTTLTALLLLVFLGLVIINFNTRVSNAQGAVQVNAADPASTAQGTVNLNVKVTGKGFKNGAQAKWFVTGTTNPGGVTVNSTTVVSSSELTANITVADAANIGNFDIAVDNPDGRGGKGTELFAVTAKGGNNAICPAMRPAPTSDTKCYSALPGCLDSTFGGVGFVNIHLGDSAHENPGNAVVVQPDAKVVVFGGAWSSSATSEDFAVIRYNTDGSLDTSFGDPDPLNSPLRLGYTVTVISTGADDPRAMVLQPDGKIVVCGTTSITNGAVARYNVDGSLDLSFGSGGVVNLNFGKRVGSPFSDLALQSDGKILIGGSAGGGFGVARLLPNGAVDADFGSGGLVVANPTGNTGGSASGFSLAIQRVPALTGEERIIVAGTSQTSSSANREWTLMRFKPNGASDPTFGVNGAVKTAFFGFGESIHRVTIDATNRIVAAGETYTASPDFCGTYTIDFALVRYTQDGVLDGSFGGGKQTIDVYGGSDSLYGLAIQADGKIVIVGYSYSSDFTVKDFTLVRFNADGSRDSSFGLQSNGVVTTNLYGFDDYADAAALQPTDGKILVAGSASLTAGGIRHIVVARYLP